MTQTPRVPNIKHLRHGLKPQRRYRRRYLTAWIDEQVTRLFGTATPETVNAVGDADPAVAEATLTCTGNFLGSDDLVIAGQTYGFNTFISGASNKDVLIGNDADATLQNLADAINSNGDTRGSAYGWSRSKNANVFAVNNGDDTLTVFAREGGVDGNSLAIDSSNAVNADFGQTTLTGGAIGNTLTVTGHGLTDASGPYFVTSTGTLPTNLAENTSYWVGVVDANTIQLYATQDDAVNGDPIDLIGQGTGTITLELGVSDDTIIEHIRDGESPRDLNTSTDIDDFD